MTDALSFFDARLTEWQVAPVCPPASNDAFAAFHDLSRTQKLSLFRQAALSDQFVPLFLGALGPAQEHDGSSYVVARIGSPSKYGEVYLVCIHGVYLAAKVLPITSDEIYAMNLKEVELATRASSLVEHGTCANFPLVYFHANNVMTTLRDANSLVALRGRLKQCRAKLIDVLLSSSQVGAAAKKLIQRRRDELMTVAADVDVSQPKQQWMAELGKVFNIDQLRIPLDVFSGAVESALEVTPSFPATLLFSELADVDFKNLFLHSARESLPVKLAACSREFQSPRVFRRLCVQMVDAIEALQAVNVVHNDLHLANVLVLCARDSPVPLIHDFGGSKEVSGAWTTGERVHDLYTLFGAMRDAAENSRLDADILELVDQVWTLLNAYLTASRTDAGLFAELRKVLETKEISQREAVERGLEASMAAMSLTRLPDARAFKQQSLRAGYAQDQGLWGVVQVQ